MVQVHHGRKTHKAANSDKFYAEWAAHQAAMAEEERDIEFDDEDVEPPIHGDEDNAELVTVIA